jgi:hypothetical protein
VVRWAIF